MLLKEKQAAEMLEAARPLIRWMNENCHPQYTALVDCVRVELLEGVAIEKTEDYLKDVGVKT